MEKNPPHITREDHPSGFNPPRPEASRGFPADFSLLPSLSNTQFRFCLEETILINYVLVCLCAIQCLSLIGRYIVCSTLNSKLHSSAISWGYLQYFNT